MTTDSARASRVNCPPGGTRWPRRSWRPPPTCSPSVVRPRRRSATSPPDPTSTTDWCFGISAPRNSWSAPCSINLGANSEPLCWTPARPPTCVDRALDRQMRVMARTLLDGYPAGQLQKRFPNIAALLDWVLPRYDDETECAARGRQCPCAAIRLAAVRADPALGDRARRADRRRNTRGGAAPRWGGSSIRLTRTRA